MFSSFFRKIIRTIIANKSSNTDSNEVFVSSSKNQKSFPRENLVASFDKDNFSSLRDLIEQLAQESEINKVRQSEIIAHLNNCNLDNSVKAFNDIRAQVISYIKSLNICLDNFNKSFSTPESSEELTNLNCLSRFTLANIEEKLKSTSLKILIVGQFKQGKSTLVNALLGENVLPAFVTPCTAVITEIAYSEKKSAQLFFKHNIKKLPRNIPQNIVNHMSSFDINNIPPLDIDIENSGGLEDCLTIKDIEKDQKHSVAESPYEKCIVSWPLELCKNGVEIIDSPGLNEAESREKTTLEYLGKADMIIHVLNCQQLAGKYDRDFIETAKIYGFNNLIFACNRFDQLNTDEDREKLKAHAYKVLTSETTLGKEGIYFISSFAALNAKKEKNESVLISSGFAAFENGLGQLVIKDRAKIKILPSLSWLSQEVNNFINQRLNPLSILLDKNASEIQKKYDEEKPKLRELKHQIAEIKDTVNKYSLQLQNTLEGWINEYVDNYINRVPAIVSSASIDITMSSEEMSREMQQHLSSHFNKDCARWFQTSLLPRLKNETEIMQQSIVKHLNKISNELCILSGSFGVVVKGDVSSIQSIQMSFENSENENYSPINGTIIAGTIGGLGTYGAAAALTLLVGGSASLLIGAIGAIAFGALYAKKKMEKAKAEYSSLIKQQMNTSKKELIKKISSNCSSYLSDEVQAAISSTESSLLAIKNNVETALRQTIDDSNEIEQKKQKVREYVKIFNVIKNNIEQTKNLIR